MSRDTYIKEAQAEYLEKQMGLPNADAAIYNRGLALFDLAPLDFSETAEIAEWAQRAGAFYSGKRKEIVLFSHQSNVFVLVHELVHALQDLTSPDEASASTVTMDSFLAGRAVTEGEASLVEFAARASALGFAPEDVDWQRNIDERSRLNADALIRSPDVDSDIYGSFVYSYGASYLLPLWRQSGYRRVWPQERPLPGSTRQILAGTSAREPLPEGWKQDVGARAVPALPAAYVLKHLDSFGQYVWAIYMRRLQRSWWRPGCDVWGTPELAGDQFSIFHDPVTDEVIASWSVRLASKAAIDSEPSSNFDFRSAAADPGFAASFTECFAGRPNIVAGASGADAWIVISDRATRRLEINDWQPAPPLPLPAPDAGAPIADGGVGNDTL